jgi:bifunctional UDP-N-acetylglucosamine pyrophosphorylase/glucosamine-1-phosphate N-acetyltransferase
MGFVVTILAAGEGKRMRSELPKVLHLFKGKPMLVRILEAVNNLNPDRIIIVTGRHHKQIINTLSHYIDIFGLIFVEQPVPLGTGDAIRHCLEYYSTRDRVLILNGDMPLLSATVIDTLLRKSAKYDGGIVVAKLENPTGYGRIVYHENRLSAIVEEASCTPEQKKIDIINAGIYLFKGEVLQGYIPNLSNDNSKKEYYLTDIIKDLYLYSVGYKITTVLLQDDETIMIRGVNTPEELEELQKI